MSVAAVIYLQIFPTLSAVFGLLSAVCFAACGLAVAVGVWTKFNDRYCNSEWVWTVVASVFAISVGLLCADAALVVARWLMRS